MGFNILKHGNDGGADEGGGFTNRASFPLSNFEEMGKNHAHISFFAYFVGLPIGVIAARYLRTFTGGWLLPHMLINGLFVAPLVIAGFILGYQTTSTSELPHFTDPHQKMGLAIFILYWIQLFLGIFIHWIKVPRVFQGPLGRRPQNYLHITIGITIVILASWQTHYGLYTEWAFATGNLHPVSSGCKHFWLAILIIVWSVYGIGLLLLPRQIKQERARMQPKVIDSKERPPSA